MGKLLDAMMNDPDRAAKIREQRFANTLAVQDLHNQGVLAAQRAASEGQLATQGLANQGHLATANLQYGIGGQGDRNNLATAPYYNAIAGHQNALTEESKFKMGVARETRPALIKQNLATMGLNTLTNEGEIGTKLDEQYSKWKASNLARPEWAGESYTKATMPEVPSGWRNITFLPSLMDWLNGTSKINTAQADKIRKLNDSYLAQPR